jgi:flagellar secretion chaperone FliS
MFLSHNTRANLYKRVDVESAVNDANPLRLIVMLYDGAIRSVNEAIAAMRSGDVTEKGKAVSRATRIIEEGLRASLDPRGGKITENLNELYVYLGQRILTAHLHNDEAAFFEALKLLGTMREAWHGIEKEQNYGR